jgi:large subunit ribosomal protein L10
VELSVKKQIVSELKDNISNSNTIIVASYYGLSVKEMTLLRQNMRDLGAGLKVTKNRLVKLALSDTSFSPLSSFFSGPTAIAYSKDPVSAAKGMVQFAKQNEKLVIIGGMVENAVIDPKAVKLLAEMPSLDELRGKLIGVLSAPATKIACVLKAPASQIARVLSAYSSKV